MIAVHVTHEAVSKMGGIGAVIEGLVTSPGYREAFERTVLIGPLLTTDLPAAERVGRGGDVLYSSLDNIDTAGYASRFRPIERTYNVGIIYGLRRFGPVGGEQSAEVEVLLVDVFRCNRERLNLFKADLFSRYAVPSDRFEQVWEFEQYVRLAEPACEAMHAIDCLGSPEDPVVLLAHEYMGMPTALRAMLASRAAVRTVFYAHEVASARWAVEHHDGHDRMFYNLLRAGQREGKCLEDFFPEITGHFKHPLVKAGRYCDAIFAVGDLVAEEMRFLSPGSRTVSVEVVYNGVPAARQDLSERQVHRARMKQYARNLFGSQPDYVFTHVARPVLSKGIWRDLRLMHELEPHLARRGQTAVYFMLGTLAGQRRSKDVLQMERVYGWPVHHDHGYPDLCNGEETLGEMFEAFNRHHDTVRAVLVNQFGWQRRLCGLRMPEDTSIDDIRRGTDVEFGLSVYEPFGISQLEPLAFGAICVVSSACGCLGLARHCAEGELPDNVLVGDFVRARDDLTASEAVRLRQADREALEATEARRLAEELFRRLPETEADLARLLDSGWQLGQRMGWDRVVAEYFLPAIQGTRAEDVLTGAK